MRQPNPIPTEGQYFTRTNRGTDAKARYAERPTDLIRIGKVDTVREEIELLRVDGFKPDGEPVIGRRTKMSYETWTHDSGRFTPTDPPMQAPAAEEPAPDSGVQTANTTEARLAAIEATQKRIEGKLDDLLAAARAGSAGPLFARAR